MASPSKLSKSAQRVWRYAGGGLMMDGGKDSSKMHTDGRINLEVSVQGKSQVLFEGFRHRLG
jgi:hypothetical protein